jgi:23S rRNA (uridine2552-2'-O)-methyltransferase
LEERRRDQYRKLAVEKGYRSRAAFKLLEVNKKYGFIRKGDVVLDLGAAPGGWMQVARKAVGHDGFVLGVDLKRVEPLPWSNVKSIMGDLRDASLVQRIRDVVRGEVDVVLCDVSPSVSGVWDVDHVRQLDLVKHALRISKSLLKDGGIFFSKLFQGELTDEFVRKVKEHFERVKLIRPKATRTRSAELYLLGMGFRKSEALE